MLALGIIVGLVSGLGIAAWAWGIRRDAGWPQPIGDSLALGPGVIYDEGHPLINYKGENYYPAQDGGIRKGNVVVVEHNGRHIAMVPREWVYDDRGATLLLQQQGSAWFPRDLTKRRNA